MQVIKDREIIQDHWKHLADNPIPQDGCITVSVTRWQQEKQDLLGRDGELGVRLNPEDSIEDLATDLENFQLIAIEFPSFTDGRCFSMARLLRSRYQFKGEIRAIGNFIRDQVFYLARVGFNAFEFNTSTGLEKALKPFNDFTVKYQASSDEEEPLYKRRHKDVNNPELQFNSKKEYQCCSEMGNRLASTPSPSPIPYR